MQDYKYFSSRRYRSLQRGIKNYFKSIDKFESRDRINIYSYFSGKSVRFLLAVFIGIAFILSIAIIISKSTKNNIVYGISYIGKLKALQEFDLISNPNAMGGNVIKSFDTNNSELKFFFYKIKQGESLSAISKKLGMSMDTLISLNSMDNAHFLEEGKRIIVPNLQGILYNVKKGDKIEDISKKYKISSSDVLDANDIEDGDIKEGDVLFLPGAQLTDSERAKALGYYFLKPITGTFTSGFGLRRDPFTGGMGYHPGIDISAPLGSPVKASKDGRVIFAGWNGGYGKCVIIKHLFGFESVYGHLSSIGVQKDDWVKVGQYIGRVGSTGYSTGAHLHFEIRKYGRPTNPIRLSGLAKGSGKWY